MTNVLKLWVTGLNSMDERVWVTFEEGYVDDSLASPMMIPFFNVVAYAANSGNDHVTLFLPGLQLYLNCGDVRQDKDILITRLNNFFGVHI